MKKENYSIVLYNLRLLLCGISSLMVTPLIQVLKSIHYLICLIVNNKMNLHEFNEIYLSENKKDHYNEAWIYLSNKYSYTNDVKYSVFRTFIVPVMEFILIPAFIYNLIIEVKDSFNKCDKTK